MAPDLRFGVVFLLCGCHTHLAVTRVPNDTPEELRGSASECVEYMEDLRASAKTRDVASDVVGLSGAAIAATGALVSLPALQKGSDANSFIVASSILTGVGTIVTFVGLRIDAPEEWKRKWDLANVHWVAGKKIMTQLGASADPGYRARVNYVKLRFDDCHNPGAVAVAPSVSAAGTPPGGFQTTNDDAGSPESDEHPLPSGFLRLAEVATIKQEGGDAIISFKPGDLFVDETSRLREDALAKLTELANALKEHDETIRVEDLEGRGEQRQRLAEARATVIVDFLQAKGAHAVSVGYGASHPYEVGQPLELKIRVPLRKR